MTAKEIVEKYSSQCLSLSEEMEISIIKYAKIKCLEQREICSEQYDQMEFPVEFKEGYEGIKNAPEPEFN